MSQEPEPPPNQRIFYFITWNDQPDHLIRSLAFLYHPDDFFYISVGGKKDYTPGLWQKLSFLCSKPNIAFSYNGPVTWGTSKLLYKNLLRALKTFQADGRFKWFQSLCDQSVPLISRKAILETLNQRTLFHRHSKHPVKITQNTEYTAEQVQCFRNALLNQGNYHDSDWTGNIELGKRGQAMVNLSEQKHTLVKREDSEYSVQPFNYSQSIAGYNKFVWWFEDYSEGQVLIENFDDIDCDFLGDIYKEYSLYTGHPFFTCDRKFAHFLFHDSRAKRLYGTMINTFAPEMDFFATIAGNFPLEQRGLYRHCIFSGDFANHLILEDSDSPKLPSATQAPSWLLYGRKFKNTDQAQSLFNELFEKRLESNENNTRFLTLTIIPEASSSSDTPSPLELIQEHIATEKVAYLRDFQGTQLARVEWHDSENLTVHFPKQNTQFDGHFRINQSNTFNIELPPEAPPSIRPKILNFAPPYFTSEGDWVAPINRLINPWQKNLATLLSFPQSAPSEIVLCKTWSHYQINLTEFAEEYTTGFATFSSLPDRFQNIPSWAQQRETVKLDTGQADTPPQCIETILNQHDLCYSINMGTPGISIDLTTPLNSEQQSDIFAKLSKNKQRLAINKAFPLEGALICVDIPLLNRREQWIWQPSSELKILSHENLCYLYGISGINHCSLDSFIWHSDEPGILSASGHCRYNLSQMTTCFIKITQAGHCHPPEESER